METLPWKAVLAAAAGGAVLLVSAARPAYAQKTELPETPEQKAFWTSVYTAADEGDQLLQEGRREEAIAKYRECLSLDAANGRAWVGLARAFEGLGRRQEALEAYRTLTFHPVKKRSLGMVADALDVQMDYVTLCLRMKLWEEAVQVYEAARPRMDLGPDRPPFPHFEARRYQPAQLGAAARMATATVYLRKGKYPEAEAECREAIRLRPDSALAHYALGIAQEVANRPLEARAAFQKAIDLAGRDAAIRKAARERL